MARGAVTTLGLRPRAPGAGAPDRDTCVPMLRPGDPVDRFVVEAHVGSGATADVYRVRHALLGTIHALKVIRSAGAGARFRREGKAQAAVRHRNVVGVTDAFAVGPAPALLLDWIEGPSLEARLEQAPLEPHEIEPLFRGIVEGVAAIHAAGLVHRDLKPANVMLDRGVPRVADFGLVKLLDSLDDPLRTRAGMVMGTPCYMSPEQAEDSASVGPAADVWALGVMLYELLSGVRPFDGETVDDVLEAVRRAEWLPLADVVPTHARLLDACLVADPSARLADAGQVLRRLGGTSTPVATLSRPGGSLPVARTSFVGRTEELAAIAARFDAGERLVTIVGPGGVGKTRLALAYAANRGGEAWFVDLTHARSAEAVTGAVAQALGVGLAAGDDTDAQLGRALAGRGGCLVVLDNFEQIVAAAPETVGVWRAMAPDARFLVTSRERLQLEGESCVAGEALPPEAAERLFDERARAADPAWDATGDRDAVRAILDRLDHMPLAIELAAARARLLSPRELSQRLASGFAVLRSTRRDVTDRQASVEGAIAWSWALLSRPEQVALAQLSVFPGGFTLPAAEAAIDAGCEPWELVQALADKSLIRSVDGGGRPRFAMYVTIADFAATRLGEMGAEAARARAVAWWAREAPALVQAARSADDRGPLRALAREEENLRAAFGWSSASGDPAAAELFRALERLLWASRGDGSPGHRSFIGRQAVDGILAASADRELCREARRQRLRWLVYTMSDAEVESDLAGLRDDGLAVPVHAALAALYRARRGAHTGDRAAAEAKYAFAAPMVERHLDVFDQFRLQGWWGSLAGSAGRWMEREAPFAALLERVRGDNWSEIAVLTNRGSHRQVAGMLDGAEADYARALELARRGGITKFENVNIGNLGLIAFERGRLDEARSRLGEALRRQLASGLSAVAASFAVELGWALELGGDARGAEDAFARADPAAIALLHEFDRVHAWRLVAFWRYHRGDPGGAQTAIDAALGASDNAPERPALLRLRALLVPGPVPPAGRGVEGTVAAILDLALEGAPDAPARLAAHDADGISGYVRLAARAALSGLRRRSGV